MIVYVTKSCEFDNQNFKKGEIIELAPQQAELYVGACPDSFSYIAPVKRKKAKGKDDV